MRFSSSFFGAPGLAPASRHWSSEFGVVAERLTLILIYFNFTYTSIVFHMVNLDLTSLALFVSCVTLLLR